MAYPHPLARSCPPARAWSSFSGQHHEAKWCQMLLVCFRPQIAERGTQDFSTRLIKHTELGKRVLRAGIKALAITKTFPNIRVTHHTPAQPLVTMGPKYLWILVWIFSFHYMYSSDCQWCPRERSGSLHILWGLSTGSFRLTSLTVFWTFSLQ